MPKRKTITALCTLSVVFFTSCAKSGPDAPLKVSVPATLSSIPVLALDGKDIGGHRIAVSFFQDHSLALAGFLRGDTDVLMTGFTQGTAAFKAHPEVRLLATPVWGVSSLMVRDRAITTLEALKGKKLMVPFAGSPLDEQTRAVLSGLGLEGKITIVYGPPQQAAALLAAGKTDAAALPEPIPSQLEASGKAFRLSRYQDLWAQATGGEPRSPQVSLFVMKGFADSHRGLIKDFMKAVADATAAVTADPAAAALTHADTFRIDPSIVRKGLENTLFALPPWDENMRVSAEYLKRIGAPPLDRIFFYEY